MTDYKHTPVADGIDRYQRTERRQWLFYLAVISFVFWSGFVLGRQFGKETYIISPLPTPTPVIATPTVTPTPEPTKIPERKLKGMASYYSVAGCLGCSSTLTMANGETLDDTRLTIALTPEVVSAHKLLNDIVRVINVNNGQEITAKVTDTGGFAKYNRVADLGLAVKNAINCNSLCEVEIIY